MRCGVKAVLILCALFLLHSASAAKDVIVVSFIKGPNFYIMGFSVDVNDANITELYVKGPNMVDYEPADNNETTSDFGWLKEPLTLPEAQNFSQGPWSLKFEYADGNEGIYTFNMKNGVESDEFPPVPQITQPGWGDVNVIAEDCTFRWDPNGAAADANSLILDTGLTDVESLYREDIGSGAFDPCTTSWNPGWLETGSAYFRVFYMLIQSGKTDGIVYDSVNSTAPPISWYYSIPVAIWGSGDRVNFEVTRTLDLSGDDVIDFEDFAYIAAHWLETRE